MQNYREHPACQLLIEKKQPISQMYNSTSNMDISDTEKVLPEITEFNVETKRLQCGWVEDEVLLFKLMMALIRLLRNP